MILRSEDRQAVTMLPGVHRKTFGTTDNMMLCEITLEKGAVVSPHRHPNEQVGYVVRGLIRMAVEDREEVLRPGDNYAIPADVVHGAAAVEDTVVIDIFYPQREDYK